MNPEFIRKNYERGLWSVAQVAVAAAKGVITAQQFEDITGVAYLNPDAEAAGDEEVASD